MEKTDARKLPSETLVHMRKQAIRLLKGGKKQEEVAEIVGVNRVTVGRWWGDYRTTGAKGLESKQRGRREGEQRTLSEFQEEEIKRLICDKTPDQLKLNFALWTRKAVKELIERQADIKMPVRTVGEYLKRWGFTPQKPLRKAYEQRPAEVKKWLEDEYPAIAKKAKEEGAEIHWGDETGLRNDSQHGRGYSPKGKTPVIRLCAKRSSISMISAITNQGKVRFMVFKEKLTTALLIKFMEKLTKDAGRKVFLILDNLRIHHSKEVRAWLEEHKEQIEVFYLPSYSPELNPDEYLNCDFKTGVHSFTPARDEEGLKKRAISHMRKLQKMPSRVKKYFTHPKIAYAA